MHSSLKKIGDILKQEGTSRYERYLPALNPASVQLDDRKLQDFITYAQRYSKNLLFIDADSVDIDLKDSWEYFFRNDNIVMLVANIAGRNVDELKSTYDHLSNDFKQQKNKQQFTELLDFVLSMFKRLSSWYYSISSESSLKADLSLYIQSYLQKELDSLKEIIFYIRDQGKNNYNLDDFLKEFYNNVNLPEIKELLSKDDIWEITKKENISLREQIFAGSNEEGKLFSASLTLDRIFNAIFHATSTVIGNCKNYFEKVISQKQDHPPHIAFLITFIKLYGFAQDELNKLPQRHLEYYYNEVLKIKKKEAVPDQAFVTFELAKGFDVYEVKKGTPLTAGKDDTNVELIYEADDDIAVNSGQVSSLQTVFIDRDKQNQTLNYYKYAIKNGAQPDGGGSATETPFKIFGAPNPHALSEIGFGIASTQFYLAKGQRNVTIIFQVKDTLTIDEFDTSILKLLLTGEKGWLDSDDKKNGIVIETLKKVGNHTIQLDFSISIAQPSAIIAFSSKLHSGNFNTAFPVLQCILKYPNPDHTGNADAENVWNNKISQLNILQKLKIVRTSITVQVGSIQSQVSFDGIKNLTLENSQGPLDSKKPFFPFSPIPKVGSSFYIGCKDLYYKNIDQLSINIEWLLPDDFANYYIKYLPPYDSNKFIASLSLLRGKHWQKINELSIINKDAADAKFKVIRINADKIKTDIAANQSENAVSTFDSDRKDGTIELKLHYPDFGHNIYPQLLTSAVMEKATSKSSNVDYYNIVRKQLDNAVISIKLPPDIDQRSGSLKVVVYDILERETDNDRARALMTGGLSELIKRYNGSNAITKKVEGSPVGQADGDDGRRLVNDDNFVERVFRFLKKVKIIDRNIHYDSDKQNAEQVVDAVRDKIDVKADFVMPADKELVNVMMTETNNTINKTVANIVNEILTLRSKGPVEPKAVADLMHKEFEEANKVINDIIAHKIAILLSANEIPPPPYSPVINTISLSYSSIKDSQYDSGSDQFYQISPLGVFEIDIFDGAVSRPVITSRPVLTSSIFPKSIVDNPDAEGDVQGMLFVGIADIKPYQDINMLVRMAEGTKINDKKPVPLQWWYLRNYEWIKLQDDNLVSDSTYGFQTTGIIKISIPGDADNSNIIFNNKNLFWLCAGVTGLTDAFPKFFDITTQAVTVTLKDQGNDPAHLALPLEARRIKSFVSKIPQVKKVDQPVASFFGRVNEEGQDYYTRVSERLRHKNRAINNWDYERLVLQNFPFIFKVKCLNNYYNGHFAIGHVTLVPIADLTNKSYAGNNLLIPRTSYIDLIKIEKFISAKTSPFVRIHALNPELNHVLVHCKVKFRKDVDKGYYLQQLNQDLINYLTPWAEGDVGTISFSAKIYASSIIDFIDSQKYVDYITDFVMEQYTENDEGEKDFCTEENALTSLVETQINTGHSILVSAPKHILDIVE